MRYWISLLCIIVFIAAAVFIPLLPAEMEESHPVTKEYRIESFLTPKDPLHLCNSTFLGNKFRNYYGDSLPELLIEQWRFPLGAGETIVTKEKGVEKWRGAGWTGQPLIIEDDSNSWLLIGSFDHHLKKINLNTQELAWEYEFDDIIKGTGSLWIDPSKEFSDPDRLLIIQGSRLGNQNRLRSEEVHSFRAISFGTGKEMWRYNVERTHSYSRDVDGSALILNDTLYIGLENGIFAVMDPSPASAYDTNGVKEPQVFQKHWLYTKYDKKRHGGNLVTESSACQLRDHIYISSGSGHVYGYNLKSDSIDWDFYVGSDLDGTTIVTYDSCIIFTIEKQYIRGHGGAMKIDPSKHPDSCVVWFYPVKDKKYSSWKGGIIGSAAINDIYNPDGRYPYLCAFCGIDGELCIVDHVSIDSSEMVDGPNGKNKYYQPQLVYSYTILHSISTPIFAQNRLLAGGYKGLYLFQYDEKGNFSLLDKRKFRCEASPVAYQGKIFIASRNGYLYCFSGDTTAILTD